MAKSNGFCHTFGGSPYGRPPQPPKVRVAIWAGFTISLLQANSMVAKENCEL